MQIKEGARTISYSDHGRKGAPAVLVWHGFPGSVLQAAGFLPFAQELDFRILALDRPGYGGTSPAPEPRWTCAADDAAAVLARLRISACHQIGISGGAPYARGFARRHARLALSLTTVGGLAALDARALKSLPFFERHLLRLGGLLPPSLLRPVLRWSPISNPDLSEFLVKFEKSLPRADREVLLQPEVREALLRSFRDGLTPGCEGLLLDLKSFWQLSEPEFFDLACDWHLWHGVDDTIVTPGMGRGRVPEAVLARGRWLEAHGHYSVPVRCAREILALLKR